MQASPAAKQEAGGRRQEARAHLYRNANPATSLSNPRKSAVHPRLVLSFDSARLEAMKTRTVSVVVTSAESKQNWQKW